MTSNLISICIMVTNTLCIKAGVMIGEGENAKIASLCARNFAEKKIPDGLRDIDYECIDGILDSTEKFIIGLEEESC